MKNALAGRFSIPGAFVVVTLCAIIAACGGGGGGGVNPTPPPPTPTPPPAGPTPLVGCPGGPSSVARHPLSTAYVYMAKRPPTRMMRDPYIRGRISVKFSGTERDIAQAVARVSGTRIAPANSMGYTTVSIAPGADPVAAAQLIRQTPGVLDAQPIAARYTQVVPNDPKMGLNSQICVGPQVTAVQWDMYVTWMPKGWDLQQGTITTVPIAIIDTGYDKTNADVAPKVIASAVFDQATGSENLGADSQDFGGHGTNVSGIAASVTNNLTRFAGVGWNISLLEVRVFPTPSAGNPNPGAADNDIAGAIGWAVSKGAKVISMSLGGIGPCSPTESTAINAALAANVVVVAASGNDFASAVSAPANCPGVIAVGASALDDTTNPAQPREKIATYSNYAPNNTWGVVAPGGDPDAAQQSCNPVPPCDYLQWITNAYSSTAFGGGGTGVFIAGTSQATPHVAGLAALVLSKDPPLTPAQVSGIIESSTDSILNAGQKQGFGRINALKALTITP